MESIFILRKTTQPGQSAIYMRIKLDAASVELSVGRKIDPSHWDQNNQQAACPDPKDTKLINAQLKALKNRLRDVCIELLENNEALTVEKLKAKILDKAEVKRTILAGVDRFIEPRKIEFENGKYLESSLNKLYDVKLEVAEFMQAKYRRSDILLTEVPIAFVKEFKEYLQGLNKFKPNTLNKRISWVKSIFGYLNQIGWTTYRGYELVKCDFRYSKETFLEWEELEVIENAVMPNERLQKAKDLFVFSCYTGLSYSDIMAFQKEKHYFIDKTGEQWIIKGREKKDKNGESVGVPSRIILFPEPIAILKEYNFELPKISNVNFNKYLKEIAEICGIKKHLTVHKGRHTCATLFLEQGASMDTVAAMLGHASTRTTASIYAEVSKSKMRKEVGSVRDNFAKLKASTQPL